MVVANSTSFKGLAWYGLESRGEIGKVPSEEISGIYPERKKAS
jgi:hypothetical protein